LAGVSSTDWSWAPLIADLNNDGYKDIFVSNGTRREINNKDYFASLKGEKKHKVENHSSSINNHLTLSFKGSKGNSHGIGSKVHLYHNNTYQIQELSLSRGFQSSVVKCLRASQIPWPYINTRRIDTTILKMKFFYQ